MRQAIVQGDRLRAAAPALAHRFLPHQRERYYPRSVVDVYSRSIVYWDLRESMTEAEAKVILQRVREKTSGSKTAGQFRQWTAIHRLGFQGVHSHPGHDARSKIALLFVVKRQVGALAQISKI